MRTDHPDDDQRLTRLFSRVLGIKANPAARLTDLEIQAVERELGVKLPRSYRIFLQAFGANLRCHTGLLGLPRGRMHRDLVLNNQANAANHLPPGLVKFMEEEGCPAYYLATPLMRPDGECPVVRLDPQVGICVLSGSFLLFLQQLASERVSCWRTVSQKS